MADETAISLEETNKLRAQLGLKPIAAPVPTSNNGPKAVQTEKQVHKIAHGKRVAAETAVPREQAGKGIDFDNEEVDNTDDWLAGLTSKSSKKPQEVPRNQDEYTARDVDGIKVGHSATDIGGLKDGAILTLKDESILGEEGEDAGDELVAESLVEKKRVQDNLKAKKGTDRRQFKGYDKDDDGDGENPEDAGEFVLNGGEIDIKGMEAERRQAEESAAEKPNKRKITLLEDAGDVVDSALPVADYQEAKPVKMKKLKKQASKSSKKMKLETFEVDQDLKYVELSKESVEDDDQELQSFLSAARKKSNQKKKHFTPERDDFVVKAEVKEEDGGLVIDETAEFLASIKKEETPVKAEPVETSIPAVANVVKQEPQEVVIKKESTDADFVSKEDDDVEEHVGSGLGAALKLLQSRKILAKHDEEKREADHQQRDLMRQRQLLELQKSQLAEDDVAGLARVERKEQELLANYNPVVNIRYHDQAGKSLTTREAYKQLSHAFHGKAPSNNKIDKLAKRRQH